MPKSWACPGCGARNTWVQTNCEQCGRAKPEQAAARGGSAAARSRACQVDGELLEANGYCKRGGGWPKTFEKSPFACPRCRAALSWTGDCFHCLNAGERERPGDEYAITEDHWVLSRKGPQPLVSRKQNDDALALVDAVRRAELSVAEAEELLVVIFGEEVA